MAVKIAINGFGRIGRLVMRHLMAIEKSTKKDEIDIVAINDLSDIERLAHLFEFDSVHGRFDGEVKVDKEKGVLILNGDDFKTYAERDPEDLPWDELDVDVVIESTGLFRNREGLQKHLDAGAKKVILSAPGKGVDVTVVRGVNDDWYQPDEHDIISNASCTTNCLATTVKVLDDSFGLEYGNFSTIHSYTNDQTLLDSVHKDYRRMRAGAMNMIPTTTGASKAVGVVLPHLDGKLDGIAVRVPTPNASLVDLTARLSGKVTKKDLEEAYLDASEGELEGILSFEWRSLVSSDFIGNPHSAVIDFPMLQVIEGGDESTLVKVLSWYDNEWGYAARTAELAMQVYKEGI